TGTFFAARDHLGVKPLHYAWDGATLVFGSELKAVLAHPSLASDVDLAALRLYLECQSIPAPHSVFGAVRKLPPAHSMTLRGGKLALRSYSRPDSRNKLEFPERDATDALERELRASVTGMLIADVPLGAFV